MDSSIAGSKNIKTESFIPAHSRARCITEIFDIIHILSNLIENQLKRIEREAGLNQKQTLVIKALLLSSAVSVTHLANSMCLKPATMVRVLDRLEEQGLVIRTRSRTDRRVVELRLTEKSREIEPLLHNIDQANLILFSGTEDSELKDMLGSLQRLSKLFITADIKSDQLPAAGLLKGK